MKPLIGSWKTVGTVTTPETQLAMQGTDTYEWILDGKFILHKTDVMIGTERSESLEIIGVGGDGEDARMHYFDSKGEIGEMKGSLQGSELQIDGEKIKFRGSFNEEGTNLSGKWWVEVAPADWKEHIEIRLKRMG